MKLIHRSGSVHCNDKTILSYWGCINPRYGENLMTIITDTNKKAILPPAEDLKALPSGAFGNKPHFYSLPGYYHKSTELVFATQSIHCLSRAIKRCRYGTDRIGWTAERKTTAVKLVLMCMHGMSESTHCPQLPSITLNVEVKHQIRNERHSCTRFRVTFLGRQTCFNV